MDQNKLLNRHDNFDNVMIKNRFTVNINVMNAHTPKNLEKHVYWFVYDMLILGLMPLT